MQSSFAAHVLPTTTIPNHSLLHFLCLRCYHCVDNSEPTTVESAINPSPTARARVHWVHCHRIYQMTIVESNDRAPCRRLRHGMMMNNVMKKPISSMTTIGRRESTTRTAQPLPRHVVPMQHECRCCCQSMTYPGLEPTRQ